MSRSDLVGQKPKLSFGLIGPPIYWENGRFEITVHGEGPPLCATQRKRFEEELGKVTKRIADSLRDTA